MTNTELLKLEEYINELDKKVGLSCGTKVDIQTAINKEKYKNSTKECPMCGSLNVELDYSLGELYCHKCEKLVAQT